MSDIFTHPLIVGASKDIQKHIFDASKNKFIETTNRHLKLSSDSKTISHVDASSLQTDASVQSVQPLSESTRVAYFEAKVVEIKPNGMCSIGVGANRFPNNKQPGWVENSFGYHGDDGKKFNCVSGSSTGSGSTYGPSFGEGDIVGCGVVWRSREVFFTKNGKYLGKAFDWNGKKTLYAIVGMDHAALTVNFGTKFLFDVNTLEYDETVRENQEIGSVSLESDTIHNLVKTYLIKQGYDQTLAYFDTKPGEDYELTLRSGLRRFVHIGKIDNVLEILERKHPEFFVQNPNIKALLHYQEYIEILRGGATIDALKYARKFLSNSNYETTPSLHV